ncbi:MAG TPA: biotin/lipoyl-containing protein [Aggregatilineaceae bacterium]|nr:biotin/lipoyl-containing protein [Aggregatilineaceae bacterium]
MKVIVRIEGQQFEVELGDLYARPVIATVEGQRFEVWPETSPSAGLTIPQAPRATSEMPAVRAPVASSSGLSESNSKAVLAPIPGVIVSIAVEPGAEVEQGQELCILEAMKMKNVIRSPRTGQIAAIKVAAGQHVKHHDLLMEFAE